MKIYFPSYYKEFRCIAEKCRHSCCVGWEIDVDDSTVEKYNNLGREDILCHIENGEIILGEGGRCPFLCADGLCRLISELGDSYTSVICREHPRFYHRAGGRAEGGIGAVCEEACRIILSCDDFASFVCLDSPGRELAQEHDFDAIPHREYIYSLLADTSLSYSEKLSLIREKYRLETTLRTADEWCEILCGLEYLDESHRGLFAVGPGREEYCNIYVRFLAYLLFRHLSVAENYTNLRARLGFCLLLSSVLEGYTAKEDVSFADICDHARVISEEIEYSEDNTASLIFEFEANLI